MTQRSPYRADPLSAACPLSCPSLPGDGPPLRHGFIRANGIRFHYVEAGSGPLVLLLHGFPEFWYSWNRQIRPLAERFRVVAPDLRGYNLSDKPRRGYTLDTLAADVAALVRAFGEPHAHIVGHDWGGMAAWGAAMWHPEVVDRLVVLNAPHPGPYLRELERNPRQWLKQWYVGFVQIPLLPEWLLTVDHARLVAEIFLTSSVSPAMFSAADLAAYRRAMCRPGAARGSLAYYRALRLTPPWEVGSRLRPTDAPTLVIWGAQDVALVPEMTDGMEPWVTNLHLERVPDAGHWVQHERPDLVSRLLLEHFAA